MQLNIDALLVVLYSTTSRADLMFPANPLSKFMNFPSKLHLNPTKRASRYIKGTIDFSVFYEEKNKI